MRRGENVSSIEIPRSCFAIDQNRRVTLTDYILGALRGDDMLGAANKFAVYAEKVIRVVCGRNNIAIRTPFTRDIYIAIAERERGRDDNVYYNFKCATRNIHLRRFFSMPVNKKKKKIRIVEADASTSRKWHARKLSVRKISLPAFDNCIAATHAWLVARELHLHNIRPVKNLAASQTRNYNATMKYISSLLL